MNVVSQNLKTYLSKFDQLDSITAFLNSPDVKVNDPNFIVVLRKLDDSINFLQKNVFIFFLLICTFFFFSFFFVPAFLFLLIIYSLYLLNPRAIWLSLSNCKTKD